MDATLPVHARRILRFSVAKLVFFGSVMLKQGIPSRGFPQTSPKMAEGERSDVEEQNILYDLSIHAEWPQETETTVSTRINIDCFG